MPKIDRVIFEQPFMQARVELLDDGTHNISVGVFGGTTASFSAKDEADAKAIYTTLETHYLSALNMVQETVIKQFELATEESPSSQPQS